MLIRSKPVAMIDSPIPAVRLRIRSAAAFANDAVLASMTE